MICCHIVAARYRSVNRGLYTPGATFHPTDLLFYGIAVYEGYRFSFRRLSDADLAGLAGSVD